MTLIAGHVRFDGAPHDIAPMLAATPLSRRLPWQVEKRGPAVLAAARVKDGVAFGGRVDAGRDVTSEYASQGASFPAGLVGDYTAAVWDGTLTVARDVVGARSLYWARVGGSVYFASELAALLAMREIPKDPDERTIADHLTGYYENAERTFFASIRRLPAGHVLVASPKDAVVRRVWRFDRARHEPDGDHPARFRELLGRAVSRRAASSPVNVMLSGGLDSSAIVCLLRPAAVRGYSIVFEGGGEADERGYVEALKRQGGLEVRALGGVDGGALLPKLVASLSEPPSSAVLLFYERVHAAVAEDGGRFVLDGFDGDTTVSYGLTLLQEMLSRGRLRDLMKELRAISRSYGTSVLKLIAWYLVNPPAGGSWRARVRQGLGGGPVWDPDRIVGEDLARRTELAERWKAAKPPGMTWSPREREAHADSLEWPGFVYAAESIERIAAAHGIEARHPFMDRELMEFCLGLRAEEKMSKGLTRVVLRQALEPLFPEELRARRGKAPFAKDFVRSLFSGESAIGERSDVRNRCLAPYVRWEGVEEAGARYRKSGAGWDAAKVWRVVALRAWLNGRG